MKLPGERSQRRTPFFYLGGGFVVGVIVSRNSSQMSYPSKGAVVLGIALVAWMCLRAGKRQVAEASAVAVATAISQAKAEANAAATATAHQVVQVVLASEGIVVPTQVMHEKFEQISSNNHVIDYDEAEAAEFDYEHRSS